MKIIIKEPMKFENGLGKELNFEKASLNVGDMIAVENLGGIANKKAQAYVFKKIIVNGGEFLLTENDYYSPLGIFFKKLVVEIFSAAYSIGLIKKDDVKNGSKAVKTLYENAISYNLQSYLLLFEGEAITSNPLLETSVLKLQNPIKVDVNGNEEEIELISFRQRNYGELEGAMTDIYASDLDFDISFARQYLQPHNHSCADMLPNIFELTPLVLNQMSAGDFNRVKALLITPFLQAQENLFDQLED